MPLVLTCGLQIAAALLPLASGSPPAANGVMVSLCEPWERADALAGVAMAEMLGNVLTSKFKFPQKCRQKNVR